LGTQAKALGDYMVVGKLSDWHLADLF